MPMLPLSSTILLVCMRTRYSMGNSQLLEEGVQSLILTPPINLHMHYLLVEFSLHKILKVFENAKHFGFVFKEEDPCVSTIIIDEGNIISTIANRNRGMPPHIRVNQIKGSTTFIIRAGIGKLTTLCSLARVTHRLNITI